MTTRLSRPPIWTAIVVIGAVAVACGPGNSPPAEGNYFALHTTETNHDPIYGNFTVDLATGVQGTHLKDLPGVTGSLTFFNTVTGYNGIKYIDGDPRIPASWNFLETTGPCRNQSIASSIDVNRGDVVPLNCVQVSSFSNTSFDDEGNPVSACCGTDTMANNMVLDVNERITSDDGRFKLVYQGDGNLVLYRADWTAIWSSNTYGPPNYGYAVMQSDGNFVIYSPRGGTIWATNTNNNPGAYLIVQNDGNAVIYSAGGAALWSTGTCCQ